MKTPNGPIGAVLIPSSDAGTTAARKIWEEIDPDFECGGPVGTPGRQCPHFHASSLPNDKDNTERLIHVSIASYRDPLCPVTLLSIFYHAVNPNAIRVRLLQQNFQDDVDCVESYCELATKMKGKRRGNVARIAHHGDCPHSDQIEVRRVDAAKAAGPMHARGLVSEAIADAHAKGGVYTQDFCLSVDSHMEFGYDWDKEMADMFDSTKNEYAVISTRPADLDELQRREDADNTNDLHEEVPHLCSVAFTESNVRMGKSTVARNLAKPKLTNGVWSAALSFSKCHAELKVPVDSHAPNVFDGDEFNRAVRFWTYGYDIYTPNRISIAHDYRGSRNNTFALGWRNNDDASWNDVLRASHTRLKTIVGLPGGDTDEANALQLRKSKFGLGDRRTIEQYVAFSGVDVANGSLSGGASNNRCGNLQWIPFSEHPKGPDYIPRFHDTSLEPIDEPDKTSVWHDDFGKKQGSNVEMRNDDDGAEELRNVAKKDHTKEGLVPQERETIGSKSGHFQPGLTPPKVSSKRLGYKTSAERHNAGLHKLPPMIQLSVVVLVLGVALSIFLQKGTGVGRRKFLARRKRDL